MDFYQTYYRLKKIHNLILTESTGTPKEFAEQMDIKERQLYNIMRDLRSRNLPIKYSRLVKTYYYTHYFDWERFLENGML
ncbi:MAG: hypothetical protein LBD59_03640 [Prevotellaceae bacterium]|jgi:predicted DNA-binding transcriptional regulator YafY|nr:hypothetical protein [Prevotellaceae bacterium]